MSFFETKLRWANSALVVTVDPDKAVKDAVHEVVLLNIPLADSPLVGVFFQEAMEVRPLQEAEGCSFRFKSH